MVVVVLGISHAGETPGEISEGAGDRFPLAGLDGLWFDVATNWWETIHPFVDVVW